MSAARSRVLPTPDKSSLIHRQQTADTPTTMASALSFDPIFLYIALVPGQSAKDLLAAYPQGTIQVNVTAPGGLAQERLVALLRLFAR
jgi:hypothetical protein